MDYSYSPWSNTIFAIGENMTNANSFHADQLHISLTEHDT